MKIKDIPKTERPRERLIEYGKENLSNEELLSIILKSGNGKQSVKDISINILKEVNSLENLNNINLLSDLTDDINLELMNLGKELILDYLYFFL